MGDRAPALGQGVGSVALTALSSPIAWMPFLPGMHAVTTSLGSDNTFTFNAADDKMAFVFQATSTTPPDTIKFRCVTYSSTGTIDVTLETVDATTGFPSGTPVTDSATGSVSVASTGTKTATGLSGTAALTVGESYAIVLTGASGFAGNFTVLRTTGINGGMGMPYSLTKDSAGAWAKSSTTNCGYALGMFTAGGISIPMDGFAGAYTAAFQTFADATDPDERGSRFSLPIPFTCYGAAVFANLGSGPADVHSFVLSLYSAHTSATPVAEATQTFDGDTMAANAFRVLRFSAPFNCAADTVYAIAAKSTSTTGVSLVRHQYATAAELGCYLSDDFYATARNDSSGAFTDTDTEVYSVYPLIGALDDGAGGAGGGGPLVGGRLVR